MTRFYHWTGPNFALDHKVYEQEWFKPIGLWLSKNDAWKNWCHNENFLCLDACDKYEFYLNWEKILRIESIECLRKFCKQYQVPFEQGVNWNKVSQEWDGIYFNNYE